MKQTIISILILILIASAGLGGAYLKKIEPQIMQQETVEPIRWIKKLQLLDQQWSATALNIYIHPESNFDRLAELLKSVRATKKKLLASELSQASELVQNQLAQFLLYIEDKEESIERFKSAFAIVRNSIRYLPLATQSLSRELTEYPELLKQIQSLSLRINAYLQKPDKGTQLRLLTQLSELSDQAMSYPDQLANALTNFIAHARVLVNKKPLLVNILSSIMAEKSLKSGDALIERYLQFKQHQYEEDYAIAINHYHNALIALLILVLTALIGLFWSVWLIRSHRNEIKKAIDEKTHSLQKKIKQASKMMGDQLGQGSAQTGEMAATLAHEINTPLGYLDSNLQVLQNSLDKIQQLSNALDEFSTLLDEKDHQKLKEQLQHWQKRLYRLKEEAMIEEMPEIIEDMQAGIEQIHHVINELRHFTRRDRAEQDWFDMRQCIEESLKMVKNKLPDSVKILTNIKKTPPLYGSPKEINQVLNNLIINAAQAVENKPEGAILIKCLTKGDRVLVSVIDNGCGIDPSIQRKIFEPFFTTKDVGKGTGLGLSIVYRIISSHQGELSLRSIPKKGTNFTFSLPVQDKEDTDE